MQKILSVIVPAYNVRPYILHCLRSFVASGIKEKIEVLIEDDGSQDGTSVLAESFANIHTDVFRYHYKVNGGHGSAVNAGIRNACGKYIMVVDADDWVNAIDFSILVDKLSCVDTDIAVCHYVRRDKKGRQYVYSGADRYDCVRNFHEIEQKQYYFGLAAICYRSALLKTGFWMPEKIYYDDLIYILEPVRKVQKIVFLNLAPYQYRVGNASQSTAKPNMEKNYLQHRKVVERLLRYEARYSDENSRQMQYIRDGIVSALKDNYNILLQGKMDTRKTRRLLRRLDALITKYHAGYFRKLDREIKLFWLMRKSNYRLIRIYRCLVMVRRQIHRERMERL